ncbi:hypothetical protein EV360DRAFT_76744 [Lentinula raphanica]|nr:hypothetical protein EV360DRAFT_76744 [Lentinula raphanica]
MPQPGSRDAPKFDGAYAYQYLVDVLTLASGAELSANEAVWYIPKYMAPEFRERIRHRVEFDTSIAGCNWDSAAAEFMIIFGQTDKPPKVTSQDLLRQAELWADQDVFKSKDDVNAYYKSYQALADPALKDEEINEKLFNLYFLMGIPSSLKPLISNRIPEDYCSRQNPYPVLDTLDLLLSLYDEEDVFYKPWRLPAKTNPQSSFDYGASNRGSTAVSNVPSYPAAPTAKSPPLPGTDTSVDDLVDLMQCLEIHKFNRVVNAIKKSFCPMCGLSGADLDHIPSVDHCDETRKLVAEGLIKKDEQKRRHVFMNGEELPRRHNGGIAKFIRQNGPSKLTNTASTSAIEVSSHPLFLTLETPANTLALDEGRATGISSLDVRNAFPSLQSGKDTSKRQDPTRRPDNKPSARQRVNENPPTQQQPQPQPVSIQDQIPQNVPPQVPAPELLPNPAPKPQFPPPGTVDVPLPPNPINRKDGWQKSQPKGKGKAKEDAGDVEMKDGAGAKDKSYHFSTDAQDAVDVEQIFNRMATETKLTLSVAELLGIAPKLEKRINEYTSRVRRYPNGPNMSNIAAELLPDDFDLDNIIPTKDIEGYESTIGREVMHTGGSSNLESLAKSPTLHSFHGSAFPPLQYRFYAMTTGIFYVEILGKKFRAMIDCGSEINAASNRVATDTGFTIDSEGTFWSMRGVHGGAERLGGCMIEVPMRIGRHTFAHHLFLVNDSNIGESFDILHQQNLF